MFSITKRFKMKKIRLRKYRKFQKTEKSYILEKTLILSIICSKCKNEYEKLFQEDESILKWKLFLN